MTAYEQLCPYEQWMVRSNLETIRTEGVTVARQAAILRANGYERIAAAVEQQAPPSDLRIGTFETVEADGEIVTGRVYNVRENGWACVETDAGRVASGPPPATAIDRKAFIDGYIECALWADCMPPESDPEGELGGRERLALRPGAREKMSVDCLDFIAANEADLIAYCQLIGGHAIVPRSAWTEGGEAFAGHDFWLTRNGHGAGFWDRGLGELGDRLTAAAKVYGSADDHRPYDCGDGTADA